MSEQIKHECGIALVRLLKPLEYFEQKYGTPLYGFQKLFLLMEKQHNRGQDGVGIGCVKLDIKAGQSYMFRERELRRNPLDRIFSRLLKGYDKDVKSGKIIPELSSTVKEHFDFGGELLLGHLRYGTSGEYSINSLHPYVRRSNWLTRNLMLAGNFNMTNLEDLNRHLISRGQHPIFATDTQTILEDIGFHLDEAHDYIYREMRDSGLVGDEIQDVISKKLDLNKIVRKSAAAWDGGYAIAGLIGNGDAFVMRDPQGIRPCFYTKTDELIAFASERAPLMTILDATKENVYELKPAQMAVIKKSGEFKVDLFAEPQKSASCSFERIYFSRGNDADIYKERKALGASLCDEVCDVIEDDFENTVFTYIPNTAEIAYFGLLAEMHKRQRIKVKEAILEASKENKITDALLDDLILKNWPRGEKIAHKDIKLRTFISQEKSRSQLASHVYDITYGVVENKDHLVCIDDSIVRGTTLRTSILRMLSRVNPKQIVVCSTAPQIRYPDCYGIDMSEIGKFIAFQAAVELLKETGRGELIREIYQDCIAQQERPTGEIVNHVKRIYEPFSAEDISDKIAEIVYPRDTEWSGKVKVIYQSIENLHKAVPSSPGDWYFTGDYPTTGGKVVVNQAFINYYENRTERSY